eukprot:Tamp_09414.p1 GENE.Tamp_09414~~Tamp_09414.p1  ORF type:complete len:510 (-),score=80.96 Tamp_09414:238-1767(-)
MGGAKNPPPKYGTPVGPNGMPQPVTLMPTQALELPGALNRCYLGLGWASQPGAREIDLDASAALFSHGKLVDIISFRKLRDSLVQGQSTCVHTGDILCGDGNKSSQSPTKDLERIYFDLYKLPDHVTTVALLINVYSEGASFSELQRATCRVVNADSEQELARFELKNLKGTGLIFGQLVRNQDACPECHGKAKGCGYCQGKAGPKAWSYVALGMSRPGRTAEDIANNLSAEALEQPPKPPPASKPGAEPQPTVAAKPTASRVSPGLVAATAVGVAAGAAIFTAVALKPDMLGGEGGGMASDLMANVGDISMPDMPDPDIDLSPVGDAMGWMGEMGGDAVSRTGEVVGDLGSSLQEGFNDLPDLGIGDAMGEGMGAAGEFAGNAAGWAGDAAGNAGEWAGDAMGGAGEFAGNAAGWAGDAAGNAGEFGGNMMGNAGEWGGNAMGSAGEFAGGAGEWAGEAAGNVGEWGSGAAATAAGFAESQDCDPSNCDPEQMIQCCLSLVGAGGNSE